jgi:hypothetical protein
MRWGEGTVIQTAEERVKFAIEFMQLDLERMRTGDWLNLQEDLQNFLFPEGIRCGFHIIPEDLLKEHSVDAIQVLRRDVEEILNLVAMFTEKSPNEENEGNKNDEDGPVPELGFLSPQLSVRPVLILFPDQRPEHPIVFWLGNFHDTFLMQLITSLAQLPLDTLRRCPECGTIFYRVRKQQYCSRPCVHRANIRTWRQSDAGREYERERSHTRYKDRVQQQLGPKVSVGRRPRSRKQRAED